MAKRKVSHHRRIKSTKAIGLGKVNSGDLIQFTYRGKDIYDIKPIVYVMSKAGKVLTGININYLKEFIVMKLLEESSVKKLKYYSLYEDSFRTYTKSKMGMIKTVQYETKKDQLDDNKMEVEEKLDLSKGSRDADKL